MGGGGLLETTGKPANLLASRVGDPSPILPEQASPVQCPSFHSISCTSFKLFPALLFLVSKDNFCWAMNLLYNCANLMYLS